jgi:hypothetical protein
MFRKAFASQKMNEPASQQKLRLSAFQVRIISFALG